MSHITNETVSSVRFEAETELALVHNHVDNARLPGSCYIAKAWQFTGRKKNIRQTLDPRTSQTTGLYICLFVCKLQQRVVCLKFKVLSQMSTLLLRFLQVTWCPGRVAGYTVCLQQGCIKARAHVQVFNVKKNLYCLKPRAETICFSF